MITFKDKKFSDYIEFQQYLIANEMRIKPQWFPHNNFFYIKHLLEEKFQRKFPLKEVRQLVKEELALKTITLYANEDSQRPSC